MNTPPQMNEIFKEICKMRARKHQKPQTFQNICFPLIMYELCEYLNHLTISLSLF